MRGETEAYVQHARAQAQQELGAWRAGVEQEVNSRREAPTGS